MVEEIGLAVVRSIELQEHAFAESESSRLLLAEELGDFTAEDARDAEIARARLAEIAANPDSVLTGALLEEKLERWQSE
jgi:hypothetical protein